MHREVIRTAKTVDIAIEEACLELGCARDECEFEILDLPKKSLFGLKSTPARVRVSAGAPEEEAVQQFKETAASKPKQENKEEKKTEAPKREEAKPSRVSAVPREDLTEKEAAAVSYMESLLKELGLAAQITCTRDESGTTLNLEGSGLGAVIGRRGETLDAIQYLTGLVANRSEGEYLRVTIDCGDYRTKRKETLESLARKLSAQVLKTNISRTLEPMNPFERRIIHATVSEIEGVSSTSVGEEPNRRVVISTPTSTRGRGSARGDGFRSRDGDRGSRRGGRPPSRDAGRKRDHDRRGSTRPSRPAAPTETHGAPKQTPEAGNENLSLYSKLDLE